MEFIAGIIEAIFGTFFQFGSAFVSDNFIEGQIPTDEAAEAELSGEDAVDETSNVVSDDVI